jgi:hypothetical protein
MASNEAETCSQPWSLFNIIQLLCLTNSNLLLSSASALNYQYLFLSLRSYGSCLHLLTRLSFTSTVSSIFLSITCYGIDNGWCCRLNSNTSCYHSLQSHVVFLCPTKGRIMGKNDQSYVQAKFHPLFYVAAASSRPKTRQPTPTKSVLPC